MWAQMNSLPSDGYNIVGINLPHIVLQPLEGQVQYKTDDVTPVYWFHYTPDAIVVATKVGSWPQRPGLSRANITAAATRSKMATKIT